MIKKKSENDGKSYAFYQIHILIKLHKLIRLVLKKIRKIQYDLANSVKASSVEWPTFNQYLR